VNNQRLVIILSIVLLALLGGGYFVLFANKAKPAPVATSEDQQILTLKPEDIGLTISARDDKHAVKFTISKASDISSVDYELDYTAEGNIPRGAVGHEDTKNGVIDTKYIELGSCSSGHCKYDAGVTEVKLVLKVNKTDGKVYEVTQTLSLTD